MSAISGVGFIVSVLLFAGPLYAQEDAAPADSLPQADLRKVPASYIKTISGKADQYYNQLTTKTEKTLAKLANWETKIKNILEKTSPETANRLFANADLTFAGMLKRYREGKAAADQYREQYNEYRDKLTSTVKYLDEKKDQLHSSVIKPLQDAKTKTDRLNAQLKNTEAVQQFIKERKKQLMQQALQHIGKSKALQKINKDSYYYFETLRNYKTLFSEPKRAEELALKLLHKIRGFDDFLRRNSMLASLFRMPGNASDPAYQASLAGLQTRAQVNALIQQQVAAGGANAREQLQQNLQAAQGQLNELKNKILKAGGGSSDADMPEGFKPNNQKTKTFLQRLEYGTNIQTQRGNSFLPNQADLALSVGYKLNDKSIIGVGASYKLGLGRGLNAIRFTSEGMGLRSFVDWKIKGSFWLSGGFEMNYKPVLRNFVFSSPAGGGREGVAWQQSGLIGLSKSVAVKSKFFKKTRLSLYWDFLSAQQIPETQALVFRIGYNF